MRISGVICCSLIFSLILFISSFSLGMKHRNRQVFVVTESINASGFIDYEEAIKYAQEHYKGSSWYLFIYDETGKLTQRIQLEKK